jgi:hypothetical protein
MPRGIVAADPPAKSLTSSAKARVHGLCAGVELGGFAG